jgi:quinol-cytochrome oxidoreductase complex cytochrome b subunit
VYQFLKVASVFSFLGSEAPRLIGIFLPALGLALLFLLPFLDRGPKRPARYRPVLLVLTAATLIVIIVLTVLGQYS